MKRLLLCICFMLLGVAMFGQTQFQWLRTPASDLTFNPDFVGYATACDASGNVFFSGFQDDEFAYGSDILGNVFIKKYDASGEQLLSKTLNGKVAVYAMTTDTDGNLLLALGYYQSITLGNIALLSVSQSIQPLLVKLDANGNLLWYFSPQITDGIVEHFDSITTDAQNNVYIGYDDYGSSYLSKLDASGNMQWTITQENVRMITSVSIDDQGNMYTAGSCANLQAKFNGVAQPVNLTYNIYIAKYDASGNFQWVRFIEDITCPKPLVKAKSPSEVYFSSYLFGNYNFGSIESEGPSNGMSDFFISRLDASGNFQWVREVPGNGQVFLGNRNTLGLDAEGNVYFAGFTRGDINWAAGQSTSATGFHNDALVLKYDPSGQVLLAKTISGSDENRFDAVSVNAQGDIFAGGLAYGPIVLDGITFSPSNAQSYPILAKITQGVLGAPDVAIQSYAIYPNPATDFISAGGINATYKAGIYNAFGQHLRSVELAPGAKIPLHGLSGGAYFIKAEGLPTKQFFKP